MLNRNMDGTAWKGHISYNWSTVREFELRLNFSDRTMPPVEDIYQLYGVCSALYIAPAQFSNIEKFDCLYEFLYGHSIEELMEVQEEGTNSMYRKYMYEPQEWTNQMVMSMDWDFFCLAYYIFLCSSNDFKSKAWEALGCILQILKNTPDILLSLLSNCGKKFDLTSCAEFWETIYDGLQTKIFEWLQEETCYKAFCSMKIVCPLFSPEKYRLFEKVCCEFLDKIARARIEEASQKIYTIRELLEFDIELLFFYQDYFMGASDIEKTKQYVMNTAFTLLHTKGDKIAIDGNVLEADMIYEFALKFAQTEFDRELISNKRTKIVDVVSVEKAEREKAYIEREKRWEEERNKQRQKDRATDKLAKFLMVVFLFSIVTTILFGILTILDVLTPFSKIMLMISLCVMVPFIIVLTITEIKDRCG